jgi:hypothetical protein
LSVPPVRRWTTGIGHAVADIFGEADRQLQDAQRIVGGLPHAG